MRLSPKKSRMMLLNATNLDRKIRDTWAEKEGRSPIKAFVQTYPVVTI
jgi:hypothetical protein